MDLLFESRVVPGGTLMDTTFSVRLDSRADAVSLRLWLSNPDAVTPSVFDGSCDEACAQHWRAILRPLLDSLWHLRAACTDRPPTPPPPPQVARVEIAARDTAALVGTTLALGATAYDAAGTVLSGVSLFWRSLDLARASVDSLGRVVLGPSAGDVYVSVTEPRSGLADTVSEHAAAEGELRWTFAVSGQMNNMAGPAPAPDGAIYVLHRGHRPADRRPGAGPQRALLGCGPGRGRRHAVPADRPPPGGARHHGCPTLACR